MKLQRKAQRETFSFFFVPFTFTHLYLHSQQRVLRATEKGSSQVVMDSDTKVPWSIISLISNYGINSVHSCLKEPPEEIYNLIFMLLTYNGILLQNWNTLLKYFSWSHFCEFFLFFFRHLKWTSVYLEIIFLGV